jgi:hypothetical protein
VGVGEAFHAYIELQSPFFERKKGRLFSVVVGRICSHIMLS